MNNGAGFSTLVREYITFFKSSLRRYFPLKFGKLGSKSFIPFPRTVYGSKRIFIGDRLVMGRHAYLHAIEKYEGETYEPEIHIGDDVYVGPRCYIASVGKVEIRNGCVLSEEVYVSDVAHGLDPTAGLIMKQKLQSKGGVSIGEGTFIGLRAAIMPGVVLGPHCVVGAGSVVTRSFSGYSMVAGNPARLVKRFDPDGKRWTPSRQQRGEEHV